MQCSLCSADGQAKGERLPPRWKRLPQSTEPCCGKCWSERYMMRAVTVAIAGPNQTGNPTEMAAHWKNLRDRLYQAWGLSTRLANWTIQQCQREDIVRTAAMPKIPPMPKVYPYGLFARYADREEWNGAAASAQSLMRTVEACWRSERFDVLWHYARSARSFRWPTPFPVHNDSWQLSRSEAGVWSCSLTLPGGRVDLRIRNDRTMHYQFRRLEQLLDGRAVPGEAAVFARVVQGTDGRNGMTMRGAGGKQDFRVMLKLAAWFLRPEAISRRQGVLVVRTGNDSLLYCEQEGEDIWNYHGDDLRRRIVGYLAGLQRWRDDTKLERRFPVQMRRRNGEEQNHRQTKHANYCNTARAEIAKMVVGLAQRRKVDCIAYDDSERGFIPQMDYADLRQRIATKANEFGIQFSVAADASTEVLNGAAADGA